MELLTQAIGFHGTTKQAVPHLLARDIQPSDQHFEWLGTGFYLWQDSPWRARQWAEERSVQPLPLAVEVRQDVAVWSGTDVVLGDLRESARFELRAETLCRRVLLEGSRAVGVELEDRRTGSRTGGCQMVCVGGASEPRR